MTPSQRIDRMIESLTDWRRETLVDVRRAILPADSQIVEARKYMGSPVRYCEGMIAVANAHKGKVKLTFAERSIFLKATTSTNRH